MILGLLRSGELLHGWPLWLQIRRYHDDDNHGNFYRNLRSLRTLELVVDRDAPANGDPRRRPYEITEKGRAEFDAWMRSPESVRTELSVWLLFYRELPKGEPIQMLQRYRDEVWLDLKRFMLEWDHVLSDKSRGPREPLNPAALIARLHIVQLTAEIQAIDEIIRMIEEDDGRGDDDD